MSQGYQEITGKLRQGSLSPQQWQAYLKSQQQQRAAFAAAAKTVQEAGVAEGVPSNTPSWQPGMSSSGASERLSNYASNISAAAAYFDIDAQLANYYSTAANNGLTVPKPALYGKSVKDERTASVILSNYVKLINQASLKKYITDSLSNLKSQAKNNGVSVPDVPINTIESITTESGASTLIGNYAALINSKLLQNSAQTAIDSITSQARAAGVTGVTVPVISSTLSSAQAASLVNDYASRVNNAILYQTVSTTLNSLKSQAVALGANIATPSLTGLTADNAQALIDSYVKKVNETLASKVQTQSAALTYKVYDSLGRTYTINAQQYAAMQKAASASANKSNTYNVIPEEVANSGTSNAGSSSWWIDSAGEYCWYPQSSSDKAHLAEINKQRARNGLSALSYLMVGPSKTAEYRAIEEEQAHQDQRDNSLTSGEIQLNKLKYSSTINNSSSAVSNTAQAVSNVKILSAAEYAAKYHPSELQLKNGTWIQKVEKVGADTNIGTITQFDSTLTANELQKLHAEYLQRVSTGISPANSVYHNDDYASYLKQIAAEVKELESQRAAFKEVVDKNGKIVEAVQVVGSKEASDYTITVFTQDAKTGKITSRSGTANEYQKALNSAKNIASIAIMPTTTAADKKIIEAARDYFNLRVTNSVDFSSLDVKKGSQSSFSSAVEVNIGKFAAALEALSKPGTQGALNAKQLKEIATNDLTLSKDINSAVNSVTIMLRGTGDSVVTTVPSIVISELRMLNSYVEQKTGKNSISDKIDTSLAWTDTHGKEALGSGIVSVTNLMVDSSPLIALNNYAKTKYGESSATKVVDLTASVVKSLPISMYEDVTEHPLSTAAELAALYTIGAAAGSVYGAGKVAEVTAIEKYLKDASTLKAAVKTGGAAIEGAVQAGMVYSLGSEAITTVKSGNVDDIVDFTKAFVFEGAGFAKASRLIEGGVASKYGMSVVESYNPLTRLAKIAGQSVGLVRGKTVDYKVDIPRASQAELIESVISKDTVSGTRGTPVHRLVSEVSGEPVGINTFRLPEKLSEVIENRRKDNIKSAGGKYTEFIENQYTLGSTLRTLSGIKQQYLTRFGDTGRVGPEYAVQANSQYMVPDVFNNEIESMGSLFLKKHGKSTLNQEVHILENIQTVASELSKLQKIQIREQYSKQGKITPELFSEVNKLAEAKSKRIGQPVATISPKTASGYYRPEAEVILVFGNKMSTEITSAKVVGHTLEGVRVKKVRLGTQSEIARELSTLENLKYNWSNITNDRYAKGMSQLINRKIAEETGLEYMKPGQYGPHGIKHTSSVADIMEDLWYRSPTLQKQYSLKLVRATGRLHDAARIYGSSKLGETEPISHGPAVAKNIRKGRIVDAELNSFTKKEQLELADAVDTHMWLDPSSKIQHITYRSSNLQKLLKSADSLARARDAGYLRKGTTFKLPEERLTYQLKTAAREGISSLSEGFSRLQKDTIAELAPRSTKAELKVLESLQKSSEKLKSEAIKEEYFAEHKSYGSEYYASKYATTVLKGLAAYTFTANEAKAYTGYLEKLYGIQGKYAPFTGYGKREYAKNSGSYEQYKNYSPAKQYSAYKNYPSSEKGYSRISKNYTTNYNYKPQTGAYEVKSNKYSKQQANYQLKTSKNNREVVIPISAYEKSTSVTNRAYSYQKQQRILKRKREQADAIKNAEKMIRLTRKLQNTLGSLDTILL